MGRGRDGETRFRGRERKRVEFRLLASLRVSQRARARHAFASRLVPITQCQSSLGSSRARSNPIATPDEPRAACRVPLGLAPRWRKPGYFP